MPNPFAPDEVQKIKELKGLIATNLKFKMLEFPVLLWEFLDKRAVLTGGAIPSLFHGEQPNDYDLYLKDQASIDAFNKIILPDSDVMKFVEDVNPKYMVGDFLVDGKLVTAQAVTFKNKVQVITMHAADAREKFDYIHCMVQYFPHTDNLYISKHQFDVIKAKRLEYNPKGITNNNMQQVRRMKYVKRGWEEA
mgnify:CR=1 FL=1